MSPDCPILIVDDDKGIRDALRDFLVHKGYAVQTAASGREALGMLGHKTPCLILLDLFMPVMNGYEFVKELNAQGLNTVTGVPVVLLSAASPNVPLLQSALRLAKGFIRKPFDLKDVTALAREHCAKP